VVSRRRPVGIEKVSGYATLTSLACLSLQAIKMGYIKTDSQDTNNRYTNQNRRISLIKTFKPYFAITKTRTIWCY